MDLNCLYFRHQIQHMRAEHSALAERRALHARRAAALAARIGGFQRTIGARAAAGWAQTIGGTAAGAVA
jgi:hypothetical protein